MLLAAVALDLLAGDPPNALHPVAWTGCLLGAMRDRAPQHQPAAELVWGALMVAAVGGLNVLAAVAVQRATAHRPLLGFVAEAALLKSAFALRALLAAGRRVEMALAAGDAPTARAAVQALVSRETAGLTAEQVAAAAVESLAENLTDSVIAPLLAYRLGGLPAALLYRVINTADAMVGYRGRYEYLGKVPARLDDVVNIVPARLAAFLIATAAPLVGGSPVAAVKMAWRDGGATASPNAGLTMAAAAGALGVQLEKVGHYRLGDPAQPVDAGTLAKARRLAAGAAALGLGLLALSYLRWRQAPPS